MRVIIAGAGFVGKAFERRIIHYGNHSVVMVDPKYKYYTQLDEQYDEMDCCIIAVNTPTINGKCDDSNVRNVLKQLPPKIPVLLKSTVLPTQMRKYPENVAYSPEFLVERRAMDDMMETEFAIIGSNFDRNIEPDFWGWFFETIGIEDYRHVDRETAAMLKYVHNAWLAIKVVFFNEIKMSGMGNYEILQELILEYFGDKFGITHMDVPGPDGKYGFGGSCFPKDTEAFLSIVKSDILKTAIDKNKKIREGQK